MRSIVVFGLAQLALIVASTVSHAATVEQVTAACDRTKGCNYHTDNNGDLVGCSTGSHTCFTCSGKTRECQAIAKRGDGSTKPGKAGNIGGVQIPAGSQPKSVSHTPQKTSSSQPPKVTTEQHSSGGKKH